MTTTISNGTSTSTPDQVLGYQSHREPGTIVHPIIGAASPDATLRPARLRTGTLELLYLSKPAAFAAEAMHAGAGVFTLTDTAIPEAGMSYVLNGPLGQLLDDQTRNAWTLAVPYQEITP